jgi:DNA primase
MPTITNVITKDWIFKNVPVRRALSFYGKIHEFKQVRNELIGPCPLHRGAGRNSLRVDLAKDQWICSGNNWPHGGDVIDLIKDFEKITYKEAITLIQKRWIEP